MGTMCSCCYIGKTKSTIEYLRNMREQLDTEDHMTDISDFPVPVSRNFNDKRQLKYKFNLERLKTKNPYTLNIKEKRRLQKASSIHSLAN